MFSELLLDILADGQPHRLEELKVRTLLDESKIYESLSFLVGAGLPICMDSNLYTLKEGVELLNRDLIIARLINMGFDEPISLTVFTCIDSTSNWMLGKLKDQPAGSRVHVCLSEMQTQGRGRLGRHWQSPLCQNLYVSFGVQFNAPIQSLRGLSVAVGLSLADLLHGKYGIDDIKVKWPNDLLINGGKVGGILVDVISGTDDNNCQAIIGVGLNVHAAPEIPMAAGYHSACLSSYSAEGISRNELSADVIQRVCKTITKFPGNDLGGVLGVWKHFDALFNQELSVFQHEKCIVVGRATGISKDGELLVDDGRSIRVVSSGEVSLRSDL